MSLFHLLPQKIDEIASICLVAREGPGESSPSITPYSLSKKWEEVLPARYWDKKNSFYSIPLKDSISILKSLAAESALFFKEKPLICNFFAKLSLRVEAVIEGEAAFLFPSVSFSGQQFSLKEVEYLALANPPFLIHKQILRTFFDEIDTRRFQWVLQNQECDASSLKKMARDLEEEAGYGIDFSLLEEKKTQQKDVAIVLQDHFGQYIRLSSFSLQMEKDLEDVGYLLQEDGSFRLQGTDPNDALELLIGLGHLVRFSSGEEVCVAKEYSLQAEEVFGKVRLSGSIELSTFKTSAVDALLFASKNRLFFPLPGKKVCLIPKQLQVFSKNLAKNSFSVEKEGISFTPFQALQLPLAKIATPSHDIERLFRQEWFKEPYPTAHAFTGTLRPYQQEGVNWLGFLDSWRLGAILADEMGLGKTVQWIGFLSTIVKEGKHLLLAPKSLGKNWVRELSCFLPSCRVHWMQKPEEIASEADVVIASYTLFRQNSELFSSTLFRSVTLDEAQVCKNSDTQIYQALIRVQAEQKIALTGTPIENHLGELVSLFQFVLGNLPNSSLLQDLSSLKEIIRPFLLRRTKEQVAKELPEKVEKTIFLEMDEEQKALYQKWEKNGLKIIEEGKEGKTHVFELLLRLRQLALSPLLVERFLEEGDTRTSAKISYLQKELPYLFEEGKKVLLFSQFTSFLHLIQKECSSMNVPLFRIDGSTEERQEVVDCFQQTKGPALLLMSLKAGGVGLNVTAADVVILSDPWWNESAESQAIDRAHRIGRISQVTVLRLIAAETVEERMEELKLQKTHLTESFLKDSFSFSSAPSNLLFELLKSRYE